MSPPDLPARRRPLWKRVVRQPAITALRAAEIAYARLLISPPYQWVRARRLDDTPPPALRAALVAHVYYPELWDEILAAWATLPAGSPLIVTAPPDRIEALAARAAGNPLITLHGAENRGRDVAPFLALLGAGALDRFDAVLKLHTKKSPHLRQGELRRRMLFAALTGSRANVARILRHFTDPAVGLVGLAWFFRTRPLYWFGNRRLVEEICARMDPPAPVELGFFEGTMFWVRPASLAPLRALGLTAADFPPEQGQTDPTLHHALERCFTLAAHAAGQQTRAIDGRPLRPAR